MDTKGFCQICLSPITSTKKRQWSPEKRKYCDSRSCKNRGNNAFRKFGLSPLEYLKMVEKQCGRCEICNTTIPSKSDRFKNWCVDHNHKTRRVRGLLCQDCNLGISKFDEDVEKMKSAISYIEKYSEISL